MDTDRDAYADKRAKRAYDNAACFLAAAAYDAPDAQPSPNVTPNTPRVTTQSPPSLLPPTGKSSNLVVVLRVVVALCLGALGRAWKRGAR